MYVDFSLGLNTQNLNVMLFITQIILRLGINPVTIYDS